jgi:transposase-like protein
MSETLDPVAMELDQRQLAEQLLAQAKEQGVELVGPNGLLNQLTKNVLETALDAEMAEHLGYDKHDPAGRGSGNSRNGTRAKTVFTEIGPVEIEVPRDTNSSFEPQIVKKRQRRLSGIDEIVLSPTAKGLTTGEIAAHFADNVLRLCSRCAHATARPRMPRRVNRDMSQPIARQLVITVCTQIRQYRRQVQLVKLLRRQRLPRPRLLLLLLLQRGLPLLPAPQRLLHTPQRHV